MRVHRPFWAALSVLAVAAFAPVAQADEQYAGDEACAMCHEEITQQFAMTSHAVAPGWEPERGCESCHGPGAEHVDAGGDPEKILQLDGLPAREANEQCMDCHKKQESHFSFRQSLHNLGDVACIDCHSPHSTAEKMLEKKGAALCQDCHGAIASQFDLARSHPIDDCSGCHDPHQTRSLRTDTTAFRETCIDCHFDKSGPYLYDHDVVMIDGCAACHEVHGSPNRHLLKHEPQINLCYQCHSASVTPGWHSVPRFLNEKCTACHTAIHGSNTSPVFLEE